MRVAVIGAGYVGLVTGVGLAAVGHDVTCVEVDADKVGEISAGRSPLFEPGLAEQLQATLAAGTFRTVGDLAAPVRESDVILICVGTPSAPTGEIDLGFIRCAAEQIGEALRTAPGGYRVVAVKSTVIPGTTEDLVAPTLWRAAGQGPESIGIGMNPEFLREGEGVKDFSNPDRIIIGAIDERSAQVLSRLYAPFESPQVITNPRTAEMVKYTSNALLATLISFSNQIAMICEVTPGTDVQSVLDAVHLDKRLSPIVRSGDGGSNRVQPPILSFLRAGCGFGGSCLPKDVKALRAFGKTAGARTDLLDAVLDINEDRPVQLVRLAEQALGSLAGRRVAVLGLTFKAGTDDLRDSPALRVVKLLQAAGAEVHAYDPILSSESDKGGGQRLPGVSLANSIISAVTGADAALITVAATEFSALDWSEACAVMRTPVVVDGRRVLDHARGLKGVLVERIGQQPAQTRELAGRGPG